MEAMEFSTSDYYERAFEKDTEAVFIDIHSEEQERWFSCGPAVLTDILKTLDKEEVSQKKIIEEVEAAIVETRPQGSDLTAEDLGTPPEIMESILKSYGVQFKVKPSVPEKTLGTDADAEKFLDEMLKEGYAIICPVQTIPNYKEKRNIENDGHYVIVCGAVTINDKKSYITVDPMFHYYQRLSNEGSVYGMHMGDEAPEGMKKTAPEIEPDSVETRDIEYSEEELAKFGINPTKYGLRVVSAESFIRNWYDISGFGEKYNEYGIAVKILD